MALNKDTGKLIYQTDFPTNSGGVPCASPLAVNGMVYAAVLNGGEVYAVDGRSGAIRWQTKLSDTMSMPAYANGVLYVGGLRHLYALNAITGALLWQTSALGTGGEDLGWGSDQGFFTPTIGAHFVYATAGKLLLAFPLICSMPCQSAWTLTDHDGFRTGPSFADGVVYAVTGYNTDLNGPLYAVNGQTGHVLWQTPTTPAIFPLVIANGVVYQTDFFGNIYAFPAQGCAISPCKPIWSANVFDAGDNGSYSVRVVDGQLYVLTVHGHLLAYGL